MIAPLLRVGERLQRRCGRAQHHHGLTQLRPHDGDIARQVAWGLLLFIRRIVFLIDDDQTHALQRRENGGTRTNGDASLLPVHPEPLIKPLTACQTTVQDGDVAAEAGVHPGEQLRGQGDLRHQVDHLLALTQRCRHRTHVDFGLAAAGDTMEQHRAELTRGQELLDVLQRLALGWGKRDVGFVEKRHLGR
jgi:hypothetical protein